MEPVSPTTQSTDQEIITRVMNGHREDYRVLFERYQALVYRLALMRLGDRERAQDVLQEVFLAAYVNLDRLREPKAFASWIARITKNVCYNLLRQKKVRSVSVDYLKECGIEFSDSSDSPSWNEERMEAIRRVIPRLAAKYRQVIELRYTENFTYERIAQFLGLPMSTVKARLFHARKRIIKMLQREGML
jgi:RNA polymerase sigma-70 factor (ECF subfamily)